MTVTAPRDGSGTLSVALDQASDDLDFENAYDATGSVDVHATKALVGRTLTEDDTWTYTLTGEDGAPVRTEEGGALWDSATVGNGGADIDLGTLHFELADLATEGEGAAYAEERTFTYRLTESGTVDAVTNDEGAEAGKTFRVRVSQHRDGAGELDGTLEDAVPTFTNTYHASGSVDLSGTKTLSGRPLTDDDPWGFVVTATGDAPLHLCAPNTVVPITDGRAAITRTAEAWDYGFRLVYTLEDPKNSDGTYARSATYHYTVTEVGKATGVTNDPRPARNISVVVTDPRDGSGTLSVTLDQASDSLDFENAYDAEGTTGFAATKTLERAALARGAFTFELVGTNACGDGVGTQTATNGSAPLGGVADITFEDVTYTLDDLTRTDPLTGRAYDTFTYTISERIPDGATEAADGTWTLDGITYHANPQTFTVNVLDAGDGHLSVTYGGAGEPEASFENSYDAKGSVRIAARKLFQDTDGLDGAPETDFGFTVEGEHVSAGTILTTEGTDWRKADGRATYEALTDALEIRFTMDDLADHNDASDPERVTGYSQRTFAYTVCEVVPDDAINAAGTRSTSKMRSRTPTILAAHDDCDPSVEVPAASKNFLLAWMRQNACTTPARRSWPA